jgi:hypothetical protein
VGVARGVERRVEARDIKEDSKAARESCDVVPVDASPMEGPEIPFFSSPSLSWMSSVRSTSYEGGGVSRKYGGW